MKPRVTLAAVFTAVVGLVIAPGHLDPPLGSIAVLAIAAGAGAAGVLNMWYDADIAPGVQSRAAGSRARKRLHSNLFQPATQSRFLLSRSMSKRQCCSPSIFFHVVVDTVWLKRQTLKTSSLAARRRYHSVGDWQGDGNRKDRA
jgi:heme o synthase